MYKCSKCNNQLNQSKHTLTSYRCSNCNALYDISELKVTSNNLNEVLKGKTTHFRNIPSVYMLKNIVDIHTIDDLYAIYVLARPIYQSSNIPNNYIRLINNNSESYNKGKMTRILEDSRGVLLYQEQLKVILSKVCGLSVELEYTYKQLMKSRKLDTGIESKMINNMSLLGMREDECSCLLSVLISRAPYCMNKAHVKSTVSQSISELAQ